MWGEDYDYEDITERLLAEEAYAKKEEEPLDYSVVSVGVLTLGLILLVEIVRHHIDHAAHGRPFFKTVLENVYSECTFLPVVYCKCKSCFALFLPGDFVQPCWFDQLTFFWVFPPRSLRVLYLRFCI